MVKVKAINYMDMNFIRKGDLKEKSTHTHIKNKLLSSKPEGN